MAKKDAELFAEKYGVVKKYSPEAAALFGEILAECLSDNSDKLSKQAFEGDRFKNLMELVRKCGGEVPAEIKNKLLDEFGVRLDSALRDKLVNGDGKSYDELMAVAENYISDRRSQWEAILNDKVNAYLDEGISVIVGQMTAGSELGKKGFEFFCYFGTAFGFKNLKLCRKLLIAFFG